MIKIFKSTIKILIKVYEYIYNKIFIKLYKLKWGNDIEVNGKLFIRNQGQIIVKDMVKINSKYSANPIGGQSRTSFLVGCKGTLIIDKGAGISNTAFCAFDKIYIGENVFIGGGCRIYDTDFHSIYYEERIKEIDNDIQTKPVTINKGTFIGANTIVLKGVNIGENSVVGAGSVVTKNIPPNEVWAGNPAKFIKKLKNM